MKETTRDGAARETREEAGIDFRIADEPYVYLDLAHASQSHVIFLAAMESPEANPGPESFEARLFSEDEIPWDKIAFNSVDKILRLYFDDAKTGNFPFHYIERHKQGKIPKLPLKAYFSSNYLQDGLGFPYQGRFRLIFAAF